MTITIMATALLLWFAIGTTVGLVIGPLFNHTSCGCWPQNLQRASIRSVRQTQTQSR
jgi:hypothetical protein